MSTQVNFEIKLPTTGSIPKDDVEKVFLELKAELLKTADLFLAQHVTVPPVVMIRGPIIMFLAD